VAGLVFCKGACTSISQKSQVGNSSMGFYFVKEDVEELWMVLERILRMSPWT